MSVVEEHSSVRLFDLNSARGIYLRALSEEAAIGTPAPELIVELADTLNAARQIIGITRVAS